MYNFILQIIVLLSLGLIIYLFARALPRVSETALPHPQINRFEQWIKKLPLEKADAAASYWLEWFLRKSKIVILRLDNLLTKHLQNLKQPPARGKTNLFNNPAVIVDEDKNTGNSDQPVL